VACEQSSRKSCFRRCTTCRVETTSPSASWIAKPCSTTWHQRWSHETPRPHGRRNRLHSFIQKTALRSGFFFVRLANIMMHIGLRDFSRSQRRQHMAATPSDLAQTQAALLIQNINFVQTVLRAISESGQGPDRWSNWTTEREKIAGLFTSAPSPSGSWTHPVSSHWTGTCVDSNPNMRSAHPVRSRCLDSKVLHGTLTCEHPR
jgi:hypothetical protein